MFLYKRTESTFAGISGAIYAVKAQLDTCRLFLVAGWKPYDLGITLV